MATVQSFHVEQVNDSWTNESKGHTYFQMMGGRGIGPVPEEDIEFDEETGDFTLAKPYELS